MAESRATTPEPQELIRAATPESFNLDAMKQALAHDLDDSNADFPALSEILETNKNHADFNNLLEQFTPYAIPQVENEFPDIKTKLFLDIYRITKSPAFENFKKLLLSYENVEVVSLQTRLSETAKASYDYMRNNPGKTIALILFAFLIMSSGLYYFLGRRTETNKGNDNSTKPLPPSTTTPLPPSTTNILTRSLQPQTTAPYQPPQNSSLPTEMRAPWTYSALQDNKTARVLKIVPDLYVPNILRYNLQAANGHQFTHVFSYGGSVEMYCCGSGESNPNVPPSRNNLMFYYDDGRNITNAYCAAATLGGYQVVPIVDGRVDSLELSTFNQMTTQTATIFADVITGKLFANDNRIPGAQFDIEPFDITQPGQANFYRQIANNFASPANNARNEAFPNGRFFSVFTFASQVNAVLADIFNYNKNGYVIDSLYDLEGGSIPNSLQQYANLVDIEIKAMMAKSRQYNIKYQFGIPGSASTREYQSKDGIPSGYNQTEYVKIAMEAIDRNGARNDTNFLGVNVWGFADEIYQRLGGRISFFQPNIPQNETLEYLRYRL